MGTSNLLFSDTIALNSFKSVKGEYTADLNKQGDKPEDVKAKVTFRYELKGVTIESPRKPTQKKTETNRSSKEPSLKEELGRKETITAR